MPHTALTEPASAGRRKINWPRRSEAGGTSATADERPTRRWAKRVSYRWC